MDPNTIILESKNGYTVRLWNHDSDIIAFNTIRGNTSGIPFLLRWRQPKEFKKFLLEILEDFDSNVADESEVYCMSIDLSIPNTAVGNVLPMNDIIIYREPNDQYTCFYGCSVVNTYQYFTLMKSDMAIFIKNIIKAIDDKGIKREIFL